MSKDTILSVVRTGALAAVVTAVGGLSYVFAQTSPAPQPSAAATPNVLSLSEIESRLTAQGFKIKEIEIEGLLAEVEGYDADGREVELVLDRRTGETLSHKFDH